MVRSLLSSLKCAANAHKLISQRGIHQSHMASSHVTVNGLNLRYEVAGSGSKVGLCLPGALGSIKSDFGPQLSSLAGEELTLVCWDPPGYGQSRPPPRKFSNDFLRQDSTIAAQMMKILGYDKYALLGWSDGGITALMMAAAFPQQVSELVVWGANAYLTEKDIGLYNKVRDVNQWSEKMRAPLEAIYGKEDFKKTWEGWVDALAKIYQEENGDLCKTDLDKISCRTLIIHGNKDPLVPREHPDYLHSKIKGSQLVCMEDGKHNIHLRYAKEFNKLVNEFLFDKNFLVKPDGKI
ncbi:valacyclovir hydrolase-like isoform X1 [Portunus trituberculatus]|uniref:valacyclovir hydrolase-like isoform X1 n=1 Tax=Portunus trituberculatus TaxID=210409 RepID=UPI001E1CE928|nr:valacyclovir hydrolase-like isoform X1 [Portunus trituberculatus]